MSKNKFAIEVGRRIKERRKALGLSAETVAETIGVSPATIYRYESADIEKMGIDKIEPIATALQTTPAYLMGWDDIARKREQAEITIDDMAKEMDVPAALLEKWEEGEEPDSQLQDYYAGYVQAMSGVKLPASDPYDQLLQRLNGVEKIQNEILDQIAARIHATMSTADSKSFLSQFDALFQSLPEKEQKSLKKDLTGLFFKYEKKIAEAKNEIISIRQTVDKARKA